MQQENLAQILNGKRGVIIVDAHEPNDWKIEIAVWG